MNGREEGRDSKGTPLANNFPKGVIEERERIPAVAERDSSSGRILAGILR
jgi:hypothetical protein